MGLFIHAVSKAEYVGPGDVSDEEDIHVIRPGEGNEHRLNGKRAGLYRARGEEHSFCAGSYGGVDEWKRLLCEAVHDCPHWEIGFFSGFAFSELFYCPLDGAFGPETCAGLAKMFAVHRNDVVKRIAELCPDDDSMFGGPDGNAWWLEYYDDWHKAFAIAADNGFVIFG